ncbi:MAG: antibiotic biosynthesis monooxygenase [Chloroflexi bacterium]|nr:antibiotic biosynthesis monooxygenase [Chloroflexota bacterium]
MHANVLEIRIQPGKTDDTAAIYRDSVMPFATRQEGFIGALLLTDPAAGKGISVTLWETEAHLAAVVGPGYMEEQLARFAGLFAGPPVRQVYEVSVFESGTPSGGQPTQARAVAWQIRPGRTQEAVATYRDVVKPPSRQLKGFRRALLLTDPATGKGLSLTLWETEADMLAVESSGYLRQQLARFAEVFAAPPVRDLYRVSVAVGGLST